MWLADYMEAHALEPEEIARRACEYGRMMSPPLAGMPSGLLVAEIAAGAGRTHPRFADAIAAVCGATARQRDMIAPERWAHSWRMTDAAKARAAEAIKRAEAKRDAKPVVKAKPKIVECYVRHVVEIDRHGNVMRRYGTVMEAAFRRNLYEKAVRERCRRKIKNEFARSEYTFRYEDEWGKMTTEERLRDVGALAGATE